MKAEVLAAYNLPAAESPYYEIDHLVPLAIGGANVVANLWPQPWAEADQKDLPEVELQRRVCHDFLAQAHVFRNAGGEAEREGGRAQAGAPLDPRYRMRGRELPKDIGEVPDV